MSVRSSVTVLLLLLFDRVLRRLELTAAVRCCQISLLLRWHILGTSWIVGRGLDNICSDSCMRHILGRLDHLGANVSAALATHTWWHIQRALH